MKSRSIVIVLLLLIINLFPLFSGENPSWRVEGGMTFSHFQQQVKAQVGDLRGERLVYENMLGFTATGGYRIWEILYAGIYFQYDFGQRSLARFDGFDAEGKTQVKDFIGGKYNEFWFGPIIQASWRNLVAETAYTVVGIRSDDMRTDLPALDGDVTTPFRTHPTIAWMFSVGAAVPIFEKLELVVRIQYRARYYNRRGGKELFARVDHGTQSISPIIGLSWRW